MQYKDIDVRKEILRKFLKNNPNATYKQIKREIHTKVEKVYTGGMKDAFKDAGIKNPRNFERKNREEREKIIINYIKKHPGVGAHTIAKDTKINPSSIFNSIREAYVFAGITYPRIRINKSKTEKKKQIMFLVKNNPLITAREIKELSGINLYKVFKNFNEVYKELEIKDICNKNKERIKKQNQVIEFIKNNPRATQREINRTCKTHVQELFNGGIFEAYKNAQILFPYERLKIYGIGIKSVREDSKRFEDEIALKLSGYGNVNRLVRIKKGVADIVFERKDKKAIVEVKNYLKKEVSFSQINQLNSYLNDFNCNLGLLICNVKPKKDKFIIGKNRIFVLDKDELDRVPYLMEL
ncbi:MAG: restriction endonuclease [Candidatus Pacearchaeota archaeon]